MISTFVNCCDFSYAICYAINKCELYKTPQILVGFLFHLFYEDLKKYRHMQRLNTSFHILKIQSFIVTEVSHSAF